MDVFYRAREILENQHVSDTCDSFFHMPSQNVEDKTDNQYFLARMFKQNFKSFSSHNRTFTSSYLCDFSILFGSYDNCSLNLY